MREIILRDVERWFLLAFLTHFATVAALYVVLTAQRQLAVRVGAVRVSDFVRANADPALSQRVQRNLSNQFEAPVFAYFAAAVLLWAGAVSSFDVAAAWLFTAGRLIHTGVQVLTTNVPLRGQVFMINFLGLIILVAHLAAYAISTQA